MLQPFNTVPHVMVTDNPKIISLLLHNCNFATVMNHNVNFWYAGNLYVTPMKGLLTYTLRTATIDETRIQGLSN